MASDFHFTPPLSWLIFSLHFPHKTQDSTKDSVKYTFREENPRSESENHRNRAAGIKSLQAVLSGAILSGSFPLAISNSLRCCGIEFRIQLRESIANCVIAAQALTPYATKFNY
jgi:hypothetical protein